MTILRSLLAILALLCSAAAALAAPDGHEHPVPKGTPDGHAHPAPKGTPGRHDATARHPFDDVAKWVKVFDDPARDKWQKPKELVAALGLKPGQVVADLGAGTGYFEPYLSAAVGASGTVFAVDIEPGFIPHLRKRAEQDGTANVIPVLASRDNPRLPRASLDLVLIVDTYHHIDDRLGYFGRLAATLRDGGRIAIVDFVKGDIPVGPPPPHKLAREAVLEEMKLAGYKLAEELSFLPYQYALVFSR